MPPIPYAPDDPACPSCGKPIKVGTPTVLKFGQTLHPQMLDTHVAREDKRPGAQPAARAGSRARQLRATGEADPFGAAWGRRRPDSRDGCRAR